MALGDRRPTARAPPGSGEPLGPQRLVRRRDGRPADTEGEREFTLGGQPRGDLNAAFEHQQPYPVGERPVRGEPPTGAVAVAARGDRSGFEEPGQVRRTHRSGPLSHGSQSTFRGLAVVRTPLQATEWHVRSLDRQGVPLFPFRRRLSPRTRLPSGARLAPRARLSLGGRISGPPPYGRLVRLYCGLALYGASDALIIRAALGLDPWDVFHQGLSRLSGISIGVVSIVVGAVVLLLWWPIRQRPGLGTVSNVVLVGTVIDLTMAVVPQYHALAVRIPLLVAGVVLNGVATGLYISARFGPGPRDGLMTGLHRRAGRSLRLIRTAIELGVLGAGFALGGGVGVGTVLYAVTIGPLAQFFLRVFALPERPGRAPEGLAGPPSGAAAEPSSEPVPGGGEPARDPAVTASGTIRREAPERAAVDPI